MGRRSGSSGPRAADGAPGRGPAGLGRCAAALAAVVGLGGTAGAQYHEVLKLSAPDAAAWDQLGARAVALGAEHALVGVPNDDELGPESGSVRAHRRDAEGAWWPAGVLLASDGAPGAGFGEAIACAGLRAVVGAPRDAADGPNAGAAYVFERQADGHWVEVQRLAPSLAAAGNRFGTSVAIAGPLAVVGAPGASSAGPGSGAAFVFERAPGGAWVEVAALAAPGGAAFDQLGAAVALAGEQVLVAAPRDDDLGDSAGSVHAFAREPGGAFAAVAELHAADGAGSARFGTALAAHGDRALVGAPGKAGSTGGAYVLEREPGGAWVQVAVLAAAGGSYGDELGVAVALSGHRALVGAWHQGDLAPWAGAAHLYRRDPQGAWKPSAAWQASDAAPSQAFGGAVALAGPRALVGAGGDAEAAEAAGAAYLLEEPSLQGDVATVSAALGGLQWLALSAGTEHAGRPYLVLGSMSGVAPGLPLDTEHTLPLEPDAYFLHTLVHPNAPPIEGGFGWLDADGAAVAQVGILAGTELPLPELTLHHAYVVLSPLAEALFVSDPVALHLVEE